MFKFVTHYSFPLSVQFPLPGLAEPQTLPLTVQHKTRDEVTAWLAPPAEGSTRTDAELLAEVITDWSVADADGQPIAYSREALARLLDAYPAAAGTIATAYFEALQDTRRKN